MSWNADTLQILKSATVGDTPYSFHPVFVHPPKRHREEFSFTGYINFQGIEIDVENKKGSYRRGRDKDGHKWKTLMRAHYGEVRDTTGAGKGALDAYVGPNHDSSLVVVIHQHDPVTGKYDEDKVLLGFDTFEDALKLYKQQYDRPGFYKDGDHKIMPIGEFWRWAHDRANAGKKVAGLRSAVGNYFLNLSGKPAHDATYAAAERSAEVLESQMRAAHLQGIADRLRDAPIPTDRTERIWRRVSIASNQGLANLARADAAHLLTNPVDVAAAKRTVLKTRLGTGAAVLGLAGLGAGGVLAMDRRARKKHDAYQAQFKLPDVGGMPDPRSKKTSKLAELDTGVDMEKPKRRWPVGALVGGTSLGAVGAGFGAGKAGVNNFVARHLPEAISAAHEFGARVDPLVELALRNKFKPQSVGRRALLYGLGGLALGGGAGVLYDMARKEEELPKLGGMITPEAPGRPEVPGLEQPRLATPRLNPDRGKHIPTNPFRGNWKKLGAGESVLHDLGRYAGEAWSAVPIKVKHGVLGMGTLAAAGYTLKETAGQAVNPHPQGIGAGAGARTAQKVLSAGLSRAGSRPMYPAQ